jgi:hypothetical protein
MLKGGDKVVEETSRKIDVEIERNRIRITIFRGEDAEIIKLTLKEAEELSEELKQAIEAYSKRKQVRID